MLSRTLDHGVLVVTVHEAAVVRDDSRLVVHSRIDVAVATAYAVTA